MAFAVAAHCVNLFNVVLVLKRTGECQLSTTGPLPRLIILQPNFKSYKLGSYCKLSQLAEYQL